MPKVTQKDRILDHLKSGASLTPLEALQLYGSMRLSAVIHDLKKEGWDIHTDMVFDAASGKSYARYKLIAKASIWT